MLCTSIKQRNALLLIGHMMKNDKDPMKSSFAVPRRKILAGGLALGAGLGFPHIWVPKTAAAAGAGRGSIKHLIYIRLGGGFRFPCAFNADVASAFNPYGVATGVPEGVDWGVSRLLMASSYLEEAGGAAAGMKPVHELASQISVMPTVDHEPLAGGADGAHGTGLERYLTGYVGGEAGLFTRLMFGLQDRYAAAIEARELLLPAFVMGSAGMARGLGEFASHRPPILSGAGFERFASAGKGGPDWAEAMVKETDERMRNRQHPALRGRVDAYMQTRAATKAYSDIFAGEPLKIGNGSDEKFDGISNAELETIFGNSREARNLRLALRLFHYGTPAVYLDQGGYDYHSGEETNLPGAIERLNRMISSLFAVLPRMAHPDGGTYWDHTVVVLGSEFSRTARGNRFNSAGGSDHNGDNSTRWMSMPFFGGPVEGGRIVGASTGKEDLKADGKVHSYRSVFNTLMDGLGCDPQSFFPADDLVPDLLRETS